MWNSVVCCCTSHIVSQIIMCVFNKNVVRPRMESYSSMTSGTTIVCGAGQGEVRLHFKKGFLLATTACQLFVMRSN